MTTILWLLLLVTALILFSRIRASGSKKHKKYISAAAKRLNKLKEIKESAKQFSYLRKINPYIFEEMILTSILNRGVRIKRNIRYTGDGGVDGAFYLHGKKYFIQAKRYTGHINRQDVSEFIMICKKLGCNGIFVHTGRTGIASKNQENEIVQIISGRSLLDLLCGKNIKIHDIDLRN